jgi:hypothetical protein
MIHEFIEAVESIIALNDSVKYNISMGYFQGYSDEVTDPLKRRTIDIKLHYKSSSGDDIDALSVPLMYIGNENTTGDFELTSESLLLVLFSDRTLEQWVTGSEPQLLVDKVKDSKNHALAIPVNTHHSYDSIVSAVIDSTVGYRRMVKPGKKLQIGTETDELLKIMYDFINIFKTVLDATPADGDALNAALLAQLTAITALFTQMTNITKI